MRQVLLLNATYEPLTTLPLRRAICLVLREKAEIVHHDTTGACLRSATMSIEVPSVIRLRDYRRVPVRRHTVLRRSIFVRDRHTCQYCKQCFPGLRLTLDHVIPKSRGGLSIWENLVTSCRECNAKKANRTPAEAGMPLAVVPRAMSLHSARHVLRRMGEEDPKWRRYLYF